MCAKEYIEVKREDFHKYAGNTQAAHCMIYSRLPDLKFEQYPLRAAVLMQMRFDGHVGFPGGLVEPGEDVVHGLIREMQEEINLDPQSNQLSEKNHLVTHWDEASRILLHFYLYEVSQEYMREIEHRALSSHDYGEEVMGIFRVPLYTMSDGSRGLPTFLQNSFVGNAFQQLKAGLLSAAILNEDEFRTAETVSLTRLSKLL